jgi:hypothetical protein
MEIRARRPLALHPLIAEAKRRARQRRVLVVAVLMLVLGGGGATLALRPFGWLRTARSTPVRFVPGYVFTGAGGPGPPPVTGPGVSAVSAASSTDAWIIGSVAWHWNGRAWRTVPLPKGSLDLRTVAADSPRDAWAAGARGNGSLTHSQALIEHWNGTRWSVIDLPRLPASFLYSVSAAGPRSAWAVGATYRSNRAGKFYPRWTRPLLLHWNGASWREVPLPWGRSALTLDKVVATGRSSVWVVSTGQEDSVPAPSFIEHWNGTRWRHVRDPFGMSDPIAAFSATAWNDAWAVGSYAQGGNEVAKYSYALAAHWNGRSWRLTHVPNRPGDNDAALTDVVAAGTDDAWALGESQRLSLDGNNGISTTGPAALLEHWDGQSWRVTPGAAPSVFDGRPAVTATRTGSAWAIGACSDDNFILRWTAGGWVLAKHPPDRHWRGTAPAGRRHRSLPTCAPSSTP